MTRSPAVLAARPPAARPSVPAAPSVPALQVLHLDEPLPGFPTHRDYVLVAADTSGLLFWLQSVAADGPRFLVVPTSVFFPDYAPVLPPTACAELGLATAADARIFAVLTVPDGDVAAATANLRAPVVVNDTTARARQVVLSDPTHPIRGRLRR
jgi:flagellar assembly factor FliW